MKKLIYSIALVVFFLTARAQTANPGDHYAAAFSNATYQLLSLQSGVTATELSANGWDNESYTVTLPFTFSFNKAGHGSVKVYADGYIMLGQNIIAPLKCNLKDRYTINTGYHNPISWAIKGTAPNRIAMFEWDLAGIAGGGLQDYASAQVWLYETSNNIEFYYGSDKYTTTNLWQNSAQPLEGVEVGLAYYNPVTSDYNTFYSNGSPSSPSFAPATGVTSNSRFVLMSNSTTWAGTKYTITRTANGMEDPVPAFASYFNASAKTISVNGDLVKGAHVKLYDMTGKDCTTYYSPENQLTIDAANIKTGIYLLAIENKGLISTKKIFIQ